MSNKVKSRWTVTFDKDGPHELVLCGAGMFLAEVIAITGEQVVEDADYIEADESEPLAMGNVKRPQKLVVHQTHADREAALEWCFEQDLAMPVGIRGDLTVEIDGGATYVYSPCAIQRWSFAPRRVGVHETEATYELKCGGLSLGTPAGPDPIGLEAAALTLSRNAGLEDAGGDAPTAGEGLAAWLNGGTGGDAEQATSGSRPAVLVGTGLWLPGTAGNTWTWADQPWYGGQDMYVRWDGVLTDPTPPARQCLVSRWVTASNKRVWALYLEPDGKISLAVSTDGTAGTVTTWTSALPLGIAAGTQVGIMVVKLGTALQFFIFPTLENTGWVQFSPTQVVANLTPFSTTGALVEVGATAGGTADFFSGQVLRVWIANDASWSDGGAQFGADFTLGVYSTAATIGRSGTNPARLLRGSHPRFDGADDSLALDVPVPLNAAAGVSVFWVGTLNRITGDNDLVWLGTNSTNPRACLRVDDGDIKLLVRRLDGEATATITAVAAVTQYYEGSISASIDYAAGTATIYVAGNPVAAGALTSAGPTSATDSSESRIMAGQGGANPAAGDVRHVLVLEQATTPFEHAEYLATINAQS